MVDPSCSSKRSPGLPSTGRKGLMGPVPPPVEPSSSKPRDGKSLGERVRGAFVRAWGGGRSFQPQGGREETAGPQPNGLERRGQQAGGRWPLSAARPRSKRGRTLANSPRASLLPVSRCLRRTCPPQSRLFPELHQRARKHKARAKPPDLI